MAGHGRCAHRRRLRSSTAMRIPAAELWVLVPPARRRAAVGTLSVLVERMVAAAGDAACRVSGGGGGEGDAAG